MVPPIATLRDLLGPDLVLIGEAIRDDYAHDEALAVTPQPPLAVVLPTATDHVSRTLRWANDHRVPVTPRGSGTGLSGACTPRPNGIVISFERMKRIVEIDTANHAAVVEAGVTLDELNAAAGERGLVYPVFPGENSASLGGNVATNAGGMRAVRYGVTRHHVLGLEAVLPGGEVVRTGGKIVKTSTGYDLTQLVVGSEGTLCVVTQVIVKLGVRQPHTATVLAPFGDLAEAVRAVTTLLGTGVGPLVVEYIDRMTMLAITAQSGISLGVPDDVQQNAEAYLLVVLEGISSDRVSEDVERAGSVLSESGALDAFVLPGNAGGALVEAREKSFWAAKRMQASDVVDVVVPRAALPEYMAAVREVALKYGTMIPGCGHAGDGNVHLAVFEPDATKRHSLMRELFEAGRRLGGVISGEHGIGLQKKSYFLELEDPVKIALMRRIKAAFDPRGILNPGTIFD